MRLFTSSKFGKESFCRKERIENELRLKISKVLPGCVMWSKVLDGALLMVTEVKASKDLRFAKVFVRAMNFEDPDMKKVIDELNGMRHVVQGALKKEIALRFLPKLTFHIGRSYGDSEET
ncbi:ribosome-binding factor A [Candidatus Hydrogenosomobacter endosymbioticus]|uniref:Ribosome-binding factor A n=1 Tax=Candidatus Hydrogenosomobacter endosymbioticus TaxID=2558174 RepID=A0ABM7V9J3_9PROT|nr:ribosome-binding factor A [Candidatus Hydrogenosomobacter endosymbioticus]BDB96449.1 hypothetical protein HYD_5820 [Candidatus Hydrogenosomobacter endosymbioticus]